MAYLIMAHDNPAQLRELLEQLVPEGSPDVAIIHADARSQLWPDLLEAFPRDTHRVQLIRDPVAVRWGHWSQVSAVSKLIEAAVSAGCDHAHLISGIDWPVASRETIVREIAESPDLCRIAAEPGAQEDRMQEFRLDSRWLQCDPARHSFGNAAAWELRRLSRGLNALRAGLGLQRARPWGRWCKGWTWWSLPVDALAMLAIELPPLLASGRLTGTVCADEHVIPTIIAAHFPDRLAPYNRYIVWPGDASSPRLLRNDDLPAIAASETWFMRKVLASHDPFYRELPR